MYIEFVNRSIGDNEIIVRVRNAEYLTDEEISSISRKVNKIIELVNNEHILPIKDKENA